MIMETAWYELKIGTKPDETRLKAKLRLLKKLLEKGYPKETIRMIFEFIKYYTAFVQTDFYHKFDKIIEPMEKITGMTLREIIIENARQEGLEKGIEKGIEKGRQEGALLAVPVQFLLQKGMEPSEVATKLKVELEFVLKIKETLDRLN
ncbi:MAG: hypothetical protein R2830_12150 [Saprospiraceae bacterium]